MKINELTNYINELTIFPALDNGQLAWALYAVANVLNLKGKHLFCFSRLPLLPSSLVDKARRQKKVKMKKDCGIGLGNIVDNSACENSLHNWL